MTGDPLYDLIAACCRQALRDARRGRADAIIFLDDMVPEWRQFTTPSKSKADGTARGEILLAVQ